MRNYGIYLAYPQASKLLHGDFEQYLIALLKETANKPDIRFLIACPVKFAEELLLLCQREGIPTNSFDLLTPSRGLSILRFCDAYLADKARHFCLQQKQWEGVQRRGDITSKIPYKYRSWMKQKFPVCARVYKSVCTTFSYYFLGNTDSLKAVLLKISKGALFWLYLNLENRKFKEIRNQINQLKHIQAWYSPFTFCPSFNQITAPRLICFTANSSADDFELENFQAIKNVIEGAQHFVVHTNYAKWSILVNQHKVKPDTIHVLYPAANSLNRWISVVGSSDPEAAISDYCMRIFKHALRKASNAVYATSYINSSVEFLLCTGQFQSKDNILMLLAVYEYLLRRRYISQKLILARDVPISPEINRFIAKYNLSNDVIYLYNLSPSELAACYKLAELAVNLDISKGRFPAGFSEALSVGTPMVMPQTCVAEEMIQDCSLQAKMLFSLYDWKSMVGCIEWALTHRRQLLESQQAIYQQLSQHSWKSIANDHIGFLDELSSFPERTRIPDIQKLEAPVVFLHIPKTAGTAIVNYLRSNIRMGSPDAIAPPFMGDLSTIGLNDHHLLYWGHLKYGVIRDHLPSAYYITFFREPLDRVISQYKSWHNPGNLNKAWMSRMSREQIETLRFAQSATLEEFILSDNPGIINQINNVQTRFIADDPDSPEILESAIYNLSKKIYYFGIVEQFDDSILLFKRLFGNASAYGVSRKHENRSELTVAPLSAAAMDRVRQLNQKDYALYAFALKHFNEILKASMITDDSANEASAFLDKVDCLVV